MFLLDDLLLAPVNGFKFILRQVQQLADKELNDESLIKEQLLELQMRLELAEITEEDYAEAERELFARLRAIKQRQLAALGQGHTADHASIVNRAGGGAGATPRPASSRARWTRRPPSRSSNRSTAPCSPRSPTAARYSTRPTSTTCSTSAFPAWTR